MNKNFPSIARIAKELCVSPETAANVRGILDGTLAPEAFADFSRFFNPPTAAHAKMLAVNKELEGFGVEYIDSARIDYVNMGGMYTATVIYNHARERFGLTSVGDILERLHK